MSEPAGPPAEEQGGLVTRERHVFKVPAPKSSLLGKRAVRADCQCVTRTRRCMQPQTATAQGKGQQSQSCQRCAGPAACCCLQDWMPWPGRSVLSGGSQKVREPVLSSSNTAHARRAAGLLIHTQQKTRSASPTWQMHTCCTAWHFDDCRPALHVHGVLRTRSCPCPLSCARVCVLQPSGQSWLLMRQKQTQQQRQQTAPTKAATLPPAAASTGSSRRGISGGSAWRRPRTPAASAHQHARPWRLPSSGTKSGNAAGCMPAPAAVAAATGTGTGTGPGGLIGGRSLTDMAGARTAGASTAETEIGTETETGTAGRGPAAAATGSRRSAAAGTGTAADESTAAAANVTGEETLTTTAAAWTGPAGAASGILEAAAAATAGSRRAAAAAAGRRPPRRCGGTQQQTRQQQTAGGA